MGKYDGLDLFFAELGGDDHTWTVEEFERLTGVSLPPSARRSAAWWYGTPYYAVWIRHGWSVHTHLERGTVEFRRGGRPGRSQPPMATGPVASRQAVGDLILLGCVAQKQPGPAPAKDLYASPLWEKRRRYAEQSGKPWLILSAEFGLIEPDRVIPYYDRYLQKESGRYRRAWSKWVAADVVEAARRLEAGSVEVHAGAAYVESGLREHLEAAGLQVLRPLEGLRIGEQMGWYGGGPEARVVAAAPEPPAAPRSVPALREPTADHVRRLADTYQSKVLGESWEELPEAWHRPDTDPRSARLWVTFVAAVDRARDAARLWEAAHRAWQEQPWIFDPDKVAGRPFHELMEVLRRYGVSQRHTVDGSAWRMIAEALASPACPEPIRQAIDGHDAAAHAVLGAVAATWPDGAPMFPLLSGPKISPLWVRMLVFPGDARITGMGVVPVAVDTHVQRVTEMLGLVPAQPLDSDHRTRIQRVWFDAVHEAGAYGGPTGLDGTAAGIDPALWALGRQGCSRCEQARRKIPVGPICELCVLGRIDGEIGMAAAG